MSETPRCYKCGEPTKKAILREHIVTTPNGIPLYVLMSPLTAVLNVGRFTSPQP